MGTFSIWHWLIVLAVVLVLFGGRGKISSLMGDFGKGLKSFKNNMREDNSSDTAASQDTTARIESAESDGSASSEETRDKAANS
ncbi:MAG: twin-arginine translocase TatA/TatE family subunit [Alphaproteobacteria bacterium]